MKNLEKYAPELYEALIMLLFRFTSVLSDEATEQKSVIALFTALNEANQLLVKIENEQTN